MPSRSQTDSWRPWNEPWQLSRFGGGEGRSCAISVASCVRAQLECGRTRHRDAPSGRLSPLKGTDKQRDGDDLRAGCTSPFVGDSRTLLAPLFDMLFGVTLRIAALRKFVCCNSQRNAPVKFARSPRTATRI